MTTKRDRKQQRKELVRAHECARRRTRVRSLAAVLGSGLVALLALTVIAWVSDLGNDPAVVGVGLLAAQGLATWGSDDSASIAALVTVPFAAILVVRALLPASAMRGSGGGDAVGSADAAPRILD